MKPDLSRIVRRPSRFRVAVLVLSSTLAVVRPVGPAFANGWEHGAVPLEALVRALSFDSAVIRQQAAQSLGYRQQDEAVEPLLERLKAPEPDPWVRRAIYEALGAIGAEQGMESLVRCLEEEQLAPLRAACVEALGGIATDEALTAVLKALDGATDPAVRNGAVAALGAFDTPAAVSALAGVVETAESSDLRLRAVRALGRTGAEGAVPPLLAALQRDDARELRLAIVQALADIASPRATKPLTVLLNDVSEPRLRAAVAAALGASRDGDAQDALRGMLNDPVPAVQYMAIEGLERLGAVEAAPALANVAHREAAALAKREIETWIEEPLETVAALSLQTRALRAAVELDPAAARSALLEAAEPVELPRGSSQALEVADAVYRRRRVALYGLGYVDKKPEVVQRLTGNAGLEDPDPRLRAVAARSLGVLNPSGAAGMVKPLLADPAAEVRMTAARVLGRLGATDAVPMLEDALSDAWALVRKEAALALGYIGDASAEAALRQAAAQDPSDDVREAAAYAVTLLPLDGTAD